MNGVERPPDGATLKSTGTFPRYSNEKEFRGTRRLGVPHPRGLGEGPIKLHGRTQRQSDHQLCYLPRKASAEPVALGIRSREE